MATEFATPVGRLVQGAVLKLQPQLDSAGKQKIDTRTGQNAPDRVYLAIAIAKTPGVQAWWQEQARNGDGSANSFWQDIYNAGRTGYPQHFNPQTGACVHPRFAWKIIDGDGVDNNGKPNSGKEGFAGHWIIKFGGQYLPKLIHNGAYIDNPEYVKRGYFVRVFGNATPNIGAEVPGLYLNPNGVEFVAYGQEITSGPDVLALAAKAGAQHQLPAGASLTPLAGANPGLPPMGAPAGMPPLPGVGAPPPGGMAPPPAMPAPAGFTPPPALAAAAGMPPPMGALAGMPAPGGFPAPGGAPAGMPPPNHAFVANAAQGMPPPMGAPAGMPPPLQQPAAPVYAMTPAAGGFTREQYIAQGYTDAILLERGFMVRTA